MSAGRGRGSSGVQDRRAAVGRLVQEAQRSDLDGDEVGAYQNYLNCVQLVVQTMSTACSSQQGGASLPRDDGAQLFKLAKQCLERAESVYTTASSEGRGLRTGQPTPGPGHAHPGHSHPSSLQRPSSQPALRMDSHHRHSNQPSRAQSFPDRTVNRGSPQQRPSSAEKQPKANNVSALHRISYMEQARLRNRSMMQQYQAHLRKTSSGTSVEFGLDMLRRLEENVSIARIKEQALARKGHERQLRLQHESDARKFSRRTQSLELSSLSPREISEQVTVFEHGKVAFSTLKTRLGTNLDSAHVSMYNLVNEVLSTMDHPLTRLFGELQYSVYLSLKILSTSIEREGGLPSLSVSPAPSEPHSSADPEFIPEWVPATNKSCAPSNGGVPVRLSPMPECPVPSQDDDEHLDLLCSDEDDDLFPLPTSSPPHSAPPSSAPVSSPGSREGDLCSSGSLEDKLSQLRASLGVPDNAELLGRKVCSDEHYSGNETGGEGKAEPQNVDLSWTGQAGEGDFSEGAQDITDGAMFSKDREGVGEEGGEPPHEVELDEVVTFKGLSPVVCSVAMGDERQLARLHGSADAVITEVLRQVHFSLTKLEESFAASYQLDSEDSRDVCHIVLEAMFFPPILPSLILVYRCKNYKKEIAMARNMCHYGNATPKDLSVRKKFWLHDQEAPPYSQAIEELRRISSYLSPSPKLDCLVRLSKSVVRCIDQYYEAQGHPAGSADMGVGVDDILPILSYVILRSGLPGLISECALMEEFIHEGYMKGEEGFCLTSFQTALLFVSRMSS